eukprot:scaffold2658_cov98-Isochrysis_galbana.AAC.5
MRPAHLAPDNAEFAAVDFPLGLVDVRHPAHHRAHRGIRAHGHPVCRRSSARRLAKPLRSASSRPPPPLLNGAAVP